MQVPDIIIAIDGYSSTGKSSFAKIIANEFSFTYLDSGALYRAVTLFAMENGFIDDECTIDVPGLEKALTDLDIHFGEGGTYIGERCIEKEIRSLAIAGKVSPIATVPQVRNFVDNKLREVMHGIFARVDEAAKKYSLDGDYAAGAAIASFDRVARAMIAEGVV